MKKKYSLKGKGIFLKVMKGRVIKSGGITLFVRPGLGRIGVTTRHGIKGAVKRNRIKRVLREYARIHLLPQLGARDIVMIASSDTFSKKRIDL